MRLPRGRQDVALAGSQPAQQFLAGVWLNLDAKAGRLRPGRRALRPAVNADGILSGCLLARAGTWMAATAKTHGSFG